MSELGMLDQFEWTHQEPSSHVFEMQDGVFQVWTDASRSEVAFTLPGTSFDFFSDMHRCGPPSRHSIFALCIPVNMSL